MATKYEYYDTGDTASYAFANAAANGYWIAQTFTPSVSHTISSVVLKLGRAGTPGIITVSIRATSGGVPTGSDLATGTTNGDTLTTNLAVGEWRTITLTPYLLVAGTKYAIVMRTTSSVLTSYAGARGGGVGYTSGNECYDAVNDGATWTEGSEDLLFEEWGSQVLPVDAITRVTGLIHRYDRRKGIYQLEISLGDTTSIVSLPYSGSAKRATVAEQETQDNASIIKEAVKEAGAALPISAPVPSQPAELTQYAKDILLTPAGRAALARQKGIQQGVKAVVTPYAIDVLRRNKEAATILTEITRLSNAAKAPGITDYARTVLQGKIAQLQTQLKSVYASK